jgi:hypothetical protein
LPAGKEISLQARKFGGGGAFFSAAGAEESPEIPNFEGIPAIAARRRKVPLKIATSGGLLAVVGGISGPSLKISKVPPEICGSPGSFLLSREVSNFQLTGGKKSNLGENF